MNYGRLEDYEELLDKNIMTMTEQSLANDIIIARYKTVLYSYTLVMYSQFKDKYSGNSILHLNYFHFQIRKDISKC